VYESTEIYVEVEGVSDLALAKDLAEDHVSDHKDELARRVSSEGWLREETLYTIDWSNGRDEDEKADVVLKWEGDDE
jgi:hypothetical protein